MILPICLVLDFRCIGCLVVCPRRIRLVMPHSVPSPTHSLLICLLTLRMEVWAIRKVSNWHVQIDVWTECLQTVPLLWHHLRAGCNLEENVCGRYWV
jgi:hypothetical protein